MVIYSRKRLLEALEHHVLLYISDVYYVTAAASRCKYVCVVRPLLPNSHCTQIYI